MEVIIPERKSPVKIKTGITYNPIVKLSPGCKLSVLRTELNEKFTRIDFIYHADSFYANGGWVRIHDTCFIRSVGSDLKLGMIKAVNIPHEYEKLPWLRKLVHLGEWDPFDATSKINK